MTTTRLALRTGPSVPAQALIAASSSSHRFVPPRSPLLATPTTSSCPSALSQTLIAASCSCSKSGFSCPFSHALIVTALTELLAWPAWPSRPSWPAWPSRPPFSHALMDAVSLSQAIITSIAVSCPFSQTLMAHRASFVSWFCWYPPSPLTPCSAP